MPDPDYPALGASNRLPWEAEPAMVEWKHEGYDCLIRRHTVLGHLCGYVRIPAPHPLRGLPESDKRVYSLEAHGGITWTGELFGRDGWWVGFDCGHAGDRCPFADPPGRGIYRDMLYVRDQTEELAAQLADMAADADLEQAESDARAAEMVRLYCTAVEALDALLDGVLRELGDEHPTAEDEVEIARAHIRRGLDGLCLWMGVLDAG